MGRVGVDARVILNIFREMVYGGVDCIEMPLVELHWRDVVKGVMKFRVT
jgi:hypothetical protein